MDQHDVIAVSTVTQSVHVCCHALHGTLLLLLQMTLRQSLASVYQCRNNSLCAAFAGPGGSSAFCGGKCCSGVCSYNYASGTTFCCASPHPPLVASNERAPVWRTRQNT